jgi:hypothetical protein
MKISIGDILRGYPRIFSKGLMKIKSQISRRPYRDLSQKFREYEVRKENQHTRRQGVDKII